MFTRFSVENFQGFMGAQSIELAPITVIFGPNSSGKSSISRALRLVKQSLKVDPTTTSFSYKKIDTESANLKNFTNTIYGQEFRESGRLGVGIEIDLSEIRENFPHLSRVTVRQTAINEDAADTDFETALTLTSGFGQEFRLAYSKSTEKWVIQSTETAVQEFFGELLPGNDDRSPYDYLFWQCEPYMRDQGDRENWEDAWAYEAFGGKGVDDTPWYLLGHRALTGIQNFAPSDLKLLHEPPEGHKYMTIEQAREKAEHEIALIEEDRLLSEDFGYELQDAPMYETVDEWVEYLLWQDWGDAPVNLSVRDRARLGYMGFLFSSIGEVIRRSIEEFDWIEPLRDIPVEYSQGEAGTDHDPKPPYFSVWVSMLTDGRYEVHTEGIDAGELPGNHSRTYLSDHHTGATLDFSQVGTGLSQLMPVILAAFKGQAPRDPESGDAPGLPFKEVAERQGKLISEMKLEDFFDTPEFTEWSGARIQELEEKRAIMLATGTSSRTVFIEQPELHLHPKAQAQLADMFVNAWDETGSQFLIETHSESLLLRLQKRIRTGELPREAVRIVYVAPNDPGDEEDLNLEETPRFNVMSNIEMAPNGDLLDPLPISFMDLRMQDLL